MQVLRSIGGATDPAAPRAALAGPAADLVSLVPEWRPLLPAPPESPPADPAAARFRLFTAVQFFLDHAAARGPLLVVLDDLHAADAWSLLLLEFLATDHVDRALLLAGVCHDTDVESSHTLTRLLPRLRCTRRFEHVSLSGLDVDATVAILSAYGSAGDRVVIALHERTGNPYMLEESLRDLAGAGWFDQDAGRDTELLPGLLGAIPAGIRAVIGDRLARLSPESRRLLTIASVLGQEFDLATLTAIPGLAGPPLFDALDHAERTRLIAADGGTGGRCRFAHALIREAIDADLGAAQRIRLHRTEG